MDNQQELFEAFKSFKGIGSQDRAGLQMNPL